MASTPSPSLATCNTTSTSTNSVSSSNTSSSRRIRAISFGRNYFYQRGQLLLGAAAADSLENIGNDANNNKSDDAESKPAPTQSIVVATMENVPWKDQLPVAAVCTAQSTVVLTQQGHLYQTGTLHGRLWKDWTRITYPLPLQCVQVSAGRHFVVARLEAGQAVVTWGAGHFGQLGVTEQREQYRDREDDSHPGTSTTTTTTRTAMMHAPEPVLIQRLLPSVTGSPIRQVAAGDWHCLALTESGKVWCWGSNRSLQCGVKHDTNSNHGGSTVALPCPLKTLPEIVQIAAGRSHSVALAKVNHAIRTPTYTGVITDPQQAQLSLQPPSQDHQHQLYAWGASQHGQCGTGITTRRTVAGLLPASVDTLPPGLELVQIAAAGHHTLALSKAGRVFAWGDGREGQLGLSLAASNNSNTDSTSATTVHSIAQLQTSKPRLVADLDFVAVAAGHMGHSGSKAAETLASIPKIVSVHAAASYSAALSSSGHVYCWGSNDVGQLGVSTPRDLPWCDGSMDLGPFHENQSDTLTATEPTSASAEPPARPLHARNFDSNHNVLLPVRVQSADHIHVSLLAVGPNHMWCFGEERSHDSGAAAVVVGKTLHEEQEEQRHKRLTSKSLSTVPQTMESSPGDAHAVESEATQATPMEETEPKLFALSENDMAAVQEEAAVLVQKEIQNDIPTPADFVDAVSTAPESTGIALAEATTVINTTNTSGSSGSTSEEEESQTTSAVLEPSDSYFDPSANDDDAARDDDNAVVTIATTPNTTLQSSSQKSAPEVSATDATIGATASMTTTETAATSTTTTRQKRPGVLKRISSRLLRRRSPPSTSASTGMGDGGSGHHTDNAGGDGSESTVASGRRRGGGLRSLQDVLAGIKRG